MLFEVGDYLLMLKVLLIILGKKVFVLNLQLLVGLLVGLFDAVSLHFIPQLGEGLIFELELFLLILDLRDELLDFLSLGPHSMETVL